MDHFYYLFIICGNAAYTAPPAGYKGFGGTDHIAPILLSRFLQSIEIGEHFLRTGTIICIHWLLQWLQSQRLFLLPLPGIVTRIQQRSQKWPV